MRRNDIPQIKQRTAWAYLAGMIDGEGCIYCAKSSRKGTTDYYCLQLSIVNTNRRLMGWLNMHFDGYVRRIPARDKKAKDVYRWKAKSEDITMLLKGVLPYLLLKNKQASLAISFRETVVRLGVHTGPKVRKLRDSIIKQMKELNKKGK